MDIIEQAAKRLEELRRAGVELPDDMLARDPVATGNIAATLVQHESLPASHEAAVVSPPPGAMSRRITIDMQALLARGVVTPDSARSRLGDEIRVIKRPLLRNKE